MKTIVLVTAGLLIAFGASAQETPDVNRVIEEMAIVGPDALLSRVKELKDAEQALKDEASALRAQADQKEAEAAAARDRIEAVERFTNELATAMAPPVAEPVAPVVEAPEEPAAPIEVVVSEPAVVEAVAPDVAVTEVVETDEPEESEGMGGSDNQM